MHILFAQALETCAQLGLAAFLTWLVAQRLRAQGELLRMHLEQRGRVLDRFQDSESFLTFVHSEEGRRLILEPPRQTTPGLRMLQAGLLAIPAGCGLLWRGHDWLQRVKPAGDYLDTHFAFQGQRAELLGVLLIAFGVGLLAGGMLARRAGRG